MRDLIQKAWQRVHDYGLLDTLRYTGHWISEQYGERAFGIDTAGAIDASRLGHAQPDGNNYEPIGYASLRRALRAVQIRAGRDVFLDYGSGKGRAVMVAASYPFRRVIGVELSPELHAAALRNLERARARRALRCPDALFIEADAATYVPPADVTVVLVYNPFGGAVMEAVVERLRRSFLARPRALRVITRFPQGVPNPFEACSWLCRAGEVPAGYSRHGERVLLYRAAANLQSDRVPSFANAEGILSAMHAACPG